MLGLTCLWKLASICVVDASGKIVKEAKLSSEPDALIAWFKALPFSLARIGLEAGPLSQWLYAALKEAGSPWSCWRRGMSATPSRQCR